MGFESDKIMFEIYREKTYSGKYRVVYYTELDDHNKEWEINRALAGESFFDGFLKNFRKEEGKRILEGFVDRLNQGDKVDPADIAAALGDHAAN
jgi:hypothetical protein